MKQETIDLINDLKFKLKERSKDDDIAVELDSALNHIINIFVLDQDQHLFASIPTNLPPKIKAYPLHNHAQITQWHQELLEWVPKTPIRMSSLIQRCLNNIEADPWEVSESDIKSALLELNEEGKVEWDQDWDVWVRRLK